MKAHGVAASVTQATGSIIAMGESAWGAPAVAHAGPLAPGVMTPMVPPTFTVSIDESKTEVNNGLCVSTIFIDTCPSLTGKANVVDSNTSNGARLTIPIAVGANIKLAVTDTTTYSAGHFAGFRLKDETALGLSLLDGLTVHTYRDGVWSESQDADTLLDLSLGGGISTVGFVTSLPFNEIQLEVSSLVGALRDYTVYYAVARTPLPEFTLSKSGPSLAGRNIPFAYTLTLTNTGLAATFDTITLSDALPASVSPISASATDNFDCTLAATVNCTSNDSLAIGASATVTLNVSAATVGPIVNVATISGGGALLPATSNGVSTQISLLPSFTIVKSAPAIVVEDEPITYTIKITNSGTGPTFGILPVTVVDLLPIGTSFQSATGNNGFSCLELLAGTVTCTSPNEFSVGESATIEIIAEPSSLGTVGNTAVVSGGGSLLSITSNLVQTLINGRPAFTIDKSAPASILQDEPFTYTVTITNSGDGPTFGPLPVTVVDVLPVGVTFQSATGNNGFSCLELAGTVTCTTSNIFSAGESASIDILVNPTGLGTAGNLATVTGGGTLLPVDSSTVDTLINGRPSFTITKSAPPTATQESTFTYTINITNSGDAATFGLLPVTVVDTLPVGVLFQSATGDNGFSCGNVGLAVTCTSSNEFSVGESATIEIVAEATGLGPVSNTAIVSGGGSLLSITSNLVQTVLESITTQVFFSINKEAPTAVIEDEPITYTITITNVGTSDSSDVLDVLVVDTLPIGVDYVSAEGDHGFTCDAVALLVTCTSSEVFNIGESATIEIIAQPNGLGPVVNTAIVSGGGSLLDVTSNLVSTLISGRPAFTIDKQAATTVTQGEELTYTITITNSGNGPTFGPLPVLVVDTLPAGVSYVSATGNNGFSCGAVGQVVTCSTSNIFSVNETATIEIVAESTGLGSTSNIAAVSGGGTLLTISSDPVGTLINGLPAFTIDKDAPAAANQGAPFTYTITLTNTGDEATNALIPVIVADTLPVGVSYQRASGDHGFTCSAAALIVTCTTSTVFNVGDVATIEIVVEPNGLGTVANTAIASGGGTLLSITSNLVETLINGMPAFAIDVTGPISVTQNQPFTLTLMITNVGSAPTVGQINIIDTLPLGLSFVSANGDSGFTCGENLNIVTCSSSDVLTVGSNATISLVVNPTGVGAVGNTAIVSGGGALLAITSDLFDILINGLPAFTIDKQAPSAVVEGVPFTYTITLTNTGSAATNALIPVIMADTLPAGVSYQSASGDHDFTCDAVALVVTCTTSTVFAVGDVATIEIIVEPNGLGPVENIAAVSGGGTLLTLSSDPISTLINGRPAFTIDKSALENVGEGTPFTYTITITNSGNGPTFGPLPTTVVDVLPVGVTFQSATGNKGFSCLNALGTVTCTTSTVFNVGDVATIDIVVMPNALGMVANTAIASGGGTLLSITSNLVETLISGLPAFAIDVTGPMSVTQYQPFTLTLMITNVGNAPTVGQINIIDALPSGLTFVSANGDSGFSCNENLNIVTCSSNDVLTAGSNATISLVVNPTGVGTVGNTAIVSGGGALLAITSDLFDILINGVPAFTIVLDGPAVATQNVPFTYTIAVTNSGGAATSGLIQMVDPLPLGVSYVNATGTNDFVCGEDNRIVTCTTGTSIDVGATATIHLTVNPDGIGLITNSASLTGNNGLSASSNLIETEVISSTIDLITLLLDLPLNGGNPLNHSSATAFVLTGKSAPNISVLLTVSDGNDGFVTQTVMTDEEGDFTATLNVSSLADGTLTVNAVASDTAGNESKPATATILLDTIAPPAAIMLSPGAGSTITERQPAISGTGEAGATLIVAIDGQSLITTVNEDGSWTVTPETLAFGDYTPLLTIIDSAGNSTGPNPGNQFTIVLGDIPDREKLDQIIYIPLVSN